MASNIDDRTDPVDYIDSYDARSVVPRPKGTLKKGIHTINVYSKEEIEANPKLLEEGFTLDSLGQAELREIVQKGRKEAK